MSKFTISLFTTCALLTSVAAAASGGPIKAYSANFVTVATLQDIDPATGDNSVPPEYAACPSAPNPHNTVFGVNFTSGMTYLNPNNLFGLEWNGGIGPDIYLYSMATSFCATGTRVGASPVGFTNLESLAHCATDGSFYSVDFNFALHTGRLIRINPFTGIGTLAGTPMGFDVRIMGMTCDDSGTLWAITAGHGGRATELYTIDPTTGVETLVGPTGTGSQTMEALELDTCGTTARLVAGHTTLYEINSGTGAATPIGGSYDAIWSMAQIRNVLVTDTDGDGDPDCTDPDDDNDGIADAFDTEPLNANNSCSGADPQNVTFAQVVSGDVTCAAEVSISIVPFTTVLASGDLRLIAPTVTFQSGFAVAGALIVISSHPCPACSP